MTLTMTQDCFNTKNKANALKGEKVELISEAHYPVLLVRNSRGNSFSVKSEWTDYKPILGAMAGARCGKCQRGANKHDVILPQYQETILKKRFGSICDECRKKYLNT